MAASRLHHVWPRLPARLLRGLARRLRMAIRAAKAFRRRRGRYRLRKGFRFSAYLSIFNDWELLAPALASMAGHID